MPAGMPTTTLPESALARVLDSLAQANTRVMARPV